MLIVGSFCIMGDWDETPAPPDKHVIKLEPSAAWGIGTHITSRALLTQLPSIISPGMTFLDVGCGSGIPMIAAALLDAEASGFEMDTKAAKVAARNAAYSGVSVQVMTEQWHAGLEGQGSYDIALVNTGDDALLAAVLGHPTLAGKVLTFSDARSSDYPGWNVRQEEGLFRIYTREPENAPHDRSV